MHLNVFFVYIDTEIGPVQTGSPNKMPSRADIPDSN